MAEGASEEFDLSADLVVHQPGYGRGDAALPDGDADFPGWNAEIEVENDQRAVIDLKPELLWRYGGDDVGLQQQTSQQRQVTGFHQWLGLVQTHVAERLCEQFAGRRTLAG